MSEKILSSLQKLKLKNNFDAGRDLYYLQVH